MEIEQNSVSAVFGESKGETQHEPVLCASSQLLLNLMPTESTKPPASEVHDIFVTGMLLPQAKVYTRSHVIQWQEGFRTSETMDEGVKVLNMFHTYWQNASSYPHIRQCW